MIEVVAADITTLDVDAIVNAASEALRGGGGVDGAIHRAAGPGLMEELMRWPGCPTGEAVRTRGHRLKARWIIHTVGPIWRGGAHGEPALLARAYESCFARAREEPSIRSIAFPAISAGVYGYPKAEAAAIAIDAMRRHEHEVERIVACAYDESSAERYRSALERAATR